MPVTKTILKRVRLGAIVKFVGDGSANVDLGADLRLSDETLDVANIRVNINSVYYNSGAATPITLVRNGNTIQQLFGNDNWLLSQASGFVDNQDNTGNVVVTIPTGGGTLILGLTKASGFSEPNKQVQPDWQK